MNDANMEEDEYVETSDVEELANAYGLQEESDLGDRDGDSVVLGHLMSRKSLVQRRSPEVYETPRKRRKFNHPFKEYDWILAHVGSSQSPAPSHNRSLQLNQNEMQSQVNDLDVMNLPGKVRVKVDSGSASQVSTSDQLVPHFDLPMDEGFVVPYNKIGASQSPLPTSSRSQQRQALGHDYEGDLLDQFDRSLSPQVFTSQPVPLYTTPRRSLAPKASQEYSDDELALVPSDITPPLTKSRTGSRTSITSPTSEHTPLNFPASSSPPVGQSTHLQSEELPTVQAGSSSSSPRNTVTNEEGTNDDAVNRYSLRRRQPNQLHPYLYDEFQYKTVLKDNRDAIVNVLRIPRHNVNQREDRYEDEEEEEYVEEESQEQSGPNNEVHVELPVKHLPSYIDPLSESEDEPDGLEKEARRIARDKKRREKEEKAKERQKRKEEEEKQRELEHLNKGKDAKRKLKRFPVSNASSHPEEVNPPQATSPRRNHHSRTTSVSNSAGISINLPRTSRQEKSELNALRDHFMDDPTVSAEDEVPYAASPEPPPEPRPLPSRTPTPTSLGVIGLVDDSSPVRNHQEAESSDSDPQEESQDLNKRYRELFKLYPPGMARQLLQTAKNKRRGRQSESEEPAEQQPLLPGQSRIRHVVNPKDVRDIRGDSESEDSDLERRSRSPAYLYNGDIRDYLAPPDSTQLDQEGLGIGLPHPGDRHQNRRQPSTLRPPEVLEISDEESQSSSEEERVDEEDIQTLLGDDDGGIIYSMETGTMKEESMIDWMLSRTRIVGRTISNPRTTHRKRTRRTGQTGTKNSRSKYRIDVTTRGASKHEDGNQTLLSFENHTSARHSGSKKDWPQAGMATAPIEVEIPEPASISRKSWKERRKERRERARLRGVYSMANPQTTGITSGRRKKPMKITIDLDDEDFFQSFVPRPQPTAPGPVKKLKPRTDGLPAHADIVSEQAQSPQSSNESYGRRRLNKRSSDLLGKCTVDMGIETLQPGRAFDPNTLIRQGHLQSSIDILTSDYAPPCPDPIYLCGISIAPSMEVDLFLQSLDKLFDGLQGFTSDIPSDGYEEALNDWGSLSRSACHHISWLYHQHSGGARDRLSSFLKDKVLAVVANLKSRDIPTNALNIGLLSLCWLCVESSIRSGHRLYEQTSEPRELNPAHASVRLLLHYLIGYDLHKPYKAIRRDQVLAATKMECYAVQMWVYLLHILPVCDARRSTNLNEENPLWAELLSYYQSLSSANSLETSEAMWRAVFTLMVLSQFTALGIATSKFRLSGSWDFVAHAIKQVHLTQSNSDLQHLGKRTLQNRDKYTLVVIARCHRLLDHWKWSMHQAFGALNQLVHIFRARNFVNLHHEKADYPDFMLNGDWDLLSQLHSEADSAFTLILKLFMRGVTSNCLTTAETKKMIALIIPVSKFRAQKERIPGVNDLSPICNRFAALALAIAIDKGNATRAVNQVHSSIDFSSSDSTTQVLTIRGIKLLACLMIKKDAPSQEIVKWLATIIETVASAFKALKSSDTAAAEVQREHRDKITLLILLLFATGRAAMETFATEGRYPEPTFLLAYKPFLEKECFTAIEEANSNLDEMRRFVESFLDARAAYLPLKEPFLPNGSNSDPDSQDLGAFDFGIDLSDPTTLAQLEGPQRTFSCVKDKEQGADFQHKIIFSCFWISKRKIQRFCETAADPVVSHDLLRKLDSWAICLVGCMHILIQHGILLDWSFCLGEITPVLNSVRIAWLQVRVRSSIFLQMIRHDPSFFEIKSQQLLELFFETLAIPDLTTEPKFWRCIAAHEIPSNPLFKDTATPLIDPDIGITSEVQKLRELRLSMLKVLFRTVETCLEETPTSPQISNWINLCLKFFSTIRSVFQDFSDRPGEAATYNALCEDVFALLENYPRLKNHQRLKTVLDLLSRF